MKKTLALVSMISIHYLAPAQGLVDFYNNSSTAISVKASAGPVTLTAGANSYDYALFYSTTATTVLGSSASVAASETQIGSYAFQDPNWTFSLDYGSSITAPGLFTNANYSISHYSTVSGLAAGTPADFVVIGWSANIGSTLASLESFVNGTSSAVYGYLGESAVSGEISPGNGTTLTVPDILGTAAPALQGFTVGEYYFHDTPEPSTIALGAMGTLCVTARCRRVKRK